MYYYDFAYDNYVKAFRYAQEPERLKLAGDKQQAEFMGNSGTHHLTRLSGSWQCNCRQFEQLLKGDMTDRYSCAHVLAAEKILDRAR